MTASVIIELPNRSSNRKAAIATAPTPAAAGPIVRLITSIESSEKTDATPVSASTQDGERADGIGHLTWAEPP